MQVHRLWMVSCMMLAMVSATRPAVADITVQNGPLIHADGDSYPHGINPVDVTATNPPYDFGADFSDPNGKFSYNFASKGFTVQNTEDLKNTKHVWFQMIYTPGAQLPPAGANGTTFFPNLWPTLGTPNGFTTPTVTGASEYRGNGAAHPDDNVIEMTWDISPQPASETIFLNFPALGGNFGGIFQVRVETICTPEPSSFALLALGGISLAIGAHRRRRVPSI